jgi:hypothetical protein
MLLAKLAVAKPVNKLLAVYGFRWFIAVLLLICHWKASKTRFTCSMYLHTKIHFIISLLTTFNVPEMSFPFKTFNETRIYFYFSHYIQQFYSLSFFLAYSW